MESYAGNQIQIDDEAEKLAKSVGSDTEKKPRLFYYEEAVGAWCPAPDDVASILDATSHFSSHGEVVEIQFKRLDMTDQEMAELPED